MESFRFFRAERPSLILLIFILSFFSSFPFFSSGGWSPSDSSGRSDLSLSFLSLSYPSSHPFLFFLQGDGVLPILPGGVTFPYPSYLYLILLLILSFFFFRGMESSRFFRAE